MKEYLKEIVSRAPDELLARGAATQYLQARILQSLQQAGVFRSWAFHGGTALRFLYSIPRYSEDLDFSVAHPESGTPFKASIENVKKTFESEAYEVEVKISDRRAVKSAFIRFPGLPRDLGLSSDRSRVLAVKVEVDTDPPAGAATETTVIRRFVLLNLLHHDRAALFAGKLHAVLSRPYLKGRDLYDLLWYLSDPTWPEPNVVYLGNALLQSGWKGPAVTNRNWRRLAARRLRSIDWPGAIADVRPFIENTGDFDILTKKNLLRLLSGRR
jgi:predicted nucleotidyltransferase component of viral defense system